jgi:hypothetical protein
VETRRRRVSTKDLQDETRFCKSPRLDGPVAETLSKRPSSCRNTTLDSVSATPLTLVKYVIVFLQLDDSALDIVFLQLGSYTRPWGIQPGVVGLAHLMSIPATMQYMILRKKMMILKKLTHPLPKLGRFNQSTAVIVHKRARLSVCATVSEVCGSCGFHVVMIDDVSVLVVGD